MGDSLSYLDNLYVKEKNLISLAIMHETETRPSFKL